MNRLPKGCAIALIITGVLAALLLVAGYLFHPKLVSLAQEQVDQFLRKEGLFLDYELHTGRLDGAVTLRNIVAYETGTKQKRVASLDHLIIRIGLRSLFRDHVLRTRLSTRDAIFTVYGDEKTGNPAFEELNLSFDCRPGSVKIDKLATRFQGIDLQVNGEVTIEAGNAPAAAPTPVPSGSAAPAAAPAPATPLDFSAVANLAPALDYRQAAWTPRIAATLTGTHSRVRDSAWEVQVRSDSFPSKGVDLGFAGKVITGKDGNLAIEKAQLTHGEAAANVAGKLFPDTDLLEISQFDSNLDWIAILQDHPGVKGAWEGLTTIQAPQLTGAGNHHLVDPNLSRITFTLGKCAVRYRMKDGKPLPVEKISAKGLLEKGTLRLQSLSASLAKGNASGEITYTPFAEAPGWGANLKGTHLYLPEITSPVEGKALVGFVDFTFAGQGKDKPEALQGQGNVSVTQGDFFHTKVFGPLLLFLHKMSNNPDKGNPQELHAGFVIQNGVLRTENLTLEISEAHVQAKGTIDLVKEFARFEAQAKLRGPLGLTVDLIGEGPLEKVEWRKK